MLKSDSISWQKTLENSHNLQSQCLVVSALRKEMKNHLKREVGSEGTPKFGPYWKVHPVACEVNTEWQSELSLWTKTILIRGSEFLMAWTVWSQTWTVKDAHDNGKETYEVQFEEYALKLNASAFASRSTAKAKPQRRTSASSSMKNNNYWGKNLDRCWTKRIFNLRLWNVKEIDSSSSWKSTSRRRWAIEFWRIKDNLQTFLVLSSLVWRQVEEKHGRKRTKQENISVLYWFIRSNLVSPSSPRSFKTQSHWSFITGQCYYFGRFLEVRLSRGMCN